MRDIEESKILIDFHFLPCLKIYKCIASTYVTAEPFRIHICFPRSSSVQLNVRQMSDRNSAKIG